ncbi:MAG TPA: tannase/feruloyl esterase family alpha/beta hydrolase [Ramlibacter sp.]|jgi:feruloyl esterase|uniref:tannase/feruloyl esterase family alpha/beta hydrolase n=1 Tax=Ramlibacter sp. TaxID=1917967 RepID=UPI002D2398D8|nr:tannase/feruloyl esterase family alpha/beta hydrolase [Ramlibacter sp.]HZY18010.1 tannase/feruloyl esterase family alpha/beta hydrolase [Ramlibacter sp.]
MTRASFLLAACTAALLVACAGVPDAPGPQRPGAATTRGPSGAVPAADAAATCAALQGTTIAPAAIGLPSGAATVDTATFLPAAPLATVERAPTPAATITPATPAYCKVLGRIAPLDPQAPPILFQVNLPQQWNGRSVQYGGGGFNGVLINAVGLAPAQPYGSPTPLAQGYVTYGTDSGHQSRPGEPPQAFALNDEALVNFAHASYKKVRDVAVALMARHYGRGPQKLYFVGSSEGGREGLTMAQRYPADFDGIFSRVPVIHWTGLQHAGLRDGLALVGEGWLPPAKVKLVHDAVLGACDAADGLADGLVSDPVGCRTRFDVTRLRCTGAATDGCLTAAQVRAVQTLHSPLRLDVPLANGLREYPGRGPGGENTPSSGPTGGWQAWWTGSQPPAFPPVQANGIAWFYGAGAIQYFYAQDPKADLRQYDPKRHVQRVQQVSALMDSTNPDLSAFQARGGKLIVLENLADYAQSPFAGIGYHQAVVQRMGRPAVDRFFKLYAAPGVDHVGTGGPANADFLPALVAWVEQGREPAGLTLLEQDHRPPFAVTRSRPLCEWPAFPRYKGGNPAQAASFECSGG